MSKIQLGVMFGSRSCEHEVSDDQRRAADARRRPADLTTSSRSISARRASGSPAIALFEIAAYTPFDESRKGVIAGCSLDHDGRLAAR